MTQSATTPTKAHLKKGTNQKEEASLSTVMYGKVQPQAVPLEEAVLGALMLDRDALPMVMDTLRADSFYLESHQLIYGAIVRLYEKSNPVDLLTVTEELKKAGELQRAGEGYYLVELSNRVASAANIEYHSRIIAQKAIQRALIGVSTRTIRDAYEDTTDVFNLLDEAEKGLFSITQNNLSRSHQTMGGLGIKVLKRIEMISRREGGLTGIPSGFTAIDRITAGWQPSDLIIVAARPGMGKTACVLAMALNAARDFKKPVALFSLEMAAEQLMTRLISMESEINASKLRDGKLHDYEWQMLQTTVEKLDGVPIYIDDTPAINIFELRAKCRRLKQQHGIELIIVDYLQLMTGANADNRNGNREQEISSIARALKQLAKELNVPVIALSQLSRAVEIRGGSKRPQLSDLRESGSLEQDSDIVAFIYRPEYYQIMEDETGQSLKGIAEFIIAKHRNGALDTVKLKFKDTYAKFSDLDDINFDGLGTIIPAFAGANMSTNNVPLDINNSEVKNIINNSRRMNDEDIPF